MNPKYLLFFLLLSTLSFAADACIGATTNFTCGSTVTESCTLNGSVFTTGTCFSVTANDIQINCAGYLIYGDNSTGDYGVYATSNGVNVTNCDIQNFQYGIYYAAGTSNGYITNDNVSTTHTSGIAINLYNGAYYHTINNVYAEAYTNIALSNYLTSAWNTIENSTLNGSRYIGLWLRDTDENTIRNNTIIGNDTTYGSLGLYWSADRNLIANNTIISTGQTGVTTNLPVGNRFLNNTLSGIAQGFTDTGTDTLIDCQGFDNPINGTNTTDKYGIITTNGVNMTIRNCNITNFYYDIYFYGTDYGAIENTYVNTTHASGVGIRLYSGANGNRIINTTGEGTYAGIQVYNSHYNNITNTTGRSAGYGQYNQYGNYNIYNNCSGYASGTGNGIFVASNSYNTYNNCSGTGVSGFGIYLNSAMNNTIANSTAYSSSYRGTFLTASNGNNLTNIKSDAISDYSFQLSGSLNNTLTNVNGTSINSIGIYIYSSSHNNTLINAIGASNISTGLLISTSDYNTLINTTGISNTGLGMYVYTGSDYNNFTDSVGFSNATNGITLLTNTGNIFNNTNGTSMGAGLGIRLSTSSNNRFTNSIGTSNTSVGIYVDTSSSNNTFRNSTGYSIASIGFELLTSCLNNTFANGIIIGKHVTWGALLLYTSNSNNTFTNNTIDGMGGTYATRLYNNNNDNNTFAGNTFRNATSLLVIDATSDNNIFYGNNFSNATTYYVYDLNGSNFYNTTEGNLWGDINTNSSTMANGTIFSTYFPTYYIGTVGSGVPYNVSKSARFSCNFNGCGDYAPITSTLGICIPSLNITATPQNTTTGDEITVTYWLNSTCNYNATWAYLNATNFTFITSQNITLSLFNGTINGTWVITAPEVEGNYTFNYTLSDGDGNIIYSPDITITISDESMVLFGALFAMTMIALILLYVSFQVGVIDADQ